MKCKIAYLKIVVLYLSLCSFAHSGKTDKRGGHYNHKTGEYHYHHGRRAHQHISGKCNLRTNKELTLSIPKDGNEIFYLMGAGILGLSISFLVKNTEKKHKN